jgi:hypothetical protein
LISGSELSASMQTLAGAGEAFAVALAAIAGV